MSSLRRRKQSLLTKRNPAFLTQVVASAGLPICIAGGAASGGAQVVSWSSHITGPSPIKQIQIADTDLNTLTFAASGYPDYTLGRSLYIPGAPKPGPVQLTYNGNNTKTISSGAVIVISDPIFPASFGLSVFPANTMIHCEGDFRYQASQGDNGRYSVGGSSGSFLFSSADFGSQINTPAASFQNILTSDPTTVSGGNNLARSPLAILGIPTKPHVSVFSHGDSLIASTGVANGDTPPGGQQGWLARGLSSVNGNQLPWVNLGIDSNSAANVISTSSSQALIQALAQYCTHFISDFGHNSDAIAANEFARMQTIWGWLRSAPNTKIRHISHVLVIPDTNSQFSITSLTSSGATCTAVGSGIQFLSNGMTLDVSGASPSAYNGFNFIISNVIVSGSASSCQYTAGSAPGTSPATGTIVGTDFWATYANQSPKTGFDLNDPSSFASVYNAMMVAAVGTQINATFTHSVQTGVVDGHSNLWKVDGTAFGFTGSLSDATGTHPNTHGYALMGPEFNAFAATWT